MVLGELEVISGPFGSQLTCSPIPNADLQGQLRQTISHMNASIPPYEHDAYDEALEAPPDVKNFTYTVVDGQVYYREHGLLLPQELNATARKRVMGMNEIRLLTREIVALQPTVGSEKELEALRAQLNTSYDRFVKDFGVLNSAVNSRLFAKDVECNFLLALEHKAKDGSWEKSDIFHKRTVDPRRVYHHAETAAEAMYIVLNNMGRIDLNAIQLLYKKEMEEIIRELGDIIYQNPATWEENPLNGWELREEYLSGNVRRKLEVARDAAGEWPERFARNVAPLEQNLPDWIEAGQIEVRLGAKWVDREYFEQFLYETFQTPMWMRRGNKLEITLDYNPHTAAWVIHNGSFDSSVQVKEVYGTRRESAYAILEDCLNLKDTVVRDKVDDRYVVNDKETKLARGKQAQIKNAFKNWIFQDADRREALVEKYNRTFNATRPRQYDGGHLQLPGLVSTFEPYPHQQNAVARILDNTYHTLLDHKVGAGKTATMIIGSYERIRMGLSKRVMFAVPNHLTGQFGDDILKLYPDARVMVVTEKDFEKQSRQKFLNRIAFSDTQMIVLSHGQFERIPMSPEYQEQALTREVDELTAAIDRMKLEKGEKRFSIKRMEGMRSDLESRITRLQNEGKKDAGVIYFDMMGADLINVDEFDLFKNCYIFTKLQNVAGVGGAASQRAADMLMKCRYLDESGGKIVAATGTVISNAVSELYVVQRYLQERLLHEHGIYHFDEWVSDFAEVVTSLEYAPEGNGVRSRTRLSKYFNIPELINMYSLVADVVAKEDMPYLKEAEMKGGEPIIVSCPPSPELLQWVQDGVRRCQAIRNRKVDPSEDNMLKFTHEAKLSGLDMRLLDPAIPFDPNCKLAYVAAKVYEEYQLSEKENGFQIAFCDASTPNADRFNVYDEVKRLLVEKGIPEDEIAFIHDAKTSKARRELFAKCRTGEIRVMLGSTEKCGAGTNVQNRLCALHDIDAPYRPRDLEQRAGRGLRQGNLYDEIPVYRYVTERSFDAYLWNILATKQRFISQFRRGRSGQRTFEDKDETLLSFEAVQAVASGDPKIMERINLDNRISELNVLQADYNSQRYRLQDRLGKTIPTEREIAATAIRHLEKDIATAAAHPATGDDFRMEILGKSYDKREDAGQAIISQLRLMQADERRDTKEEKEIGTYRGFKVSLHNLSFYNRVSLKLYGEGIHSVEIGEESGLGNTTRMDNALKDLSHRLLSERQRLESLAKSEQSAREELERPFAFADELRDGIERLTQLDIELNLDKQVSEDAPEESAAQEPLPTHASLPDYAGEGDYEQENEQDFDMEF